MDDIVTAVRVARYNEVIVVNVDGQDIALVASIDPLYGGISWQNASSSDSTVSDAEVCMVRHFRAKRWILPMLNDNTRNLCYERAIQQACKTLNKQTIGGDEEILRILDIGSGTGLLAMMAYRYATTNEVSTPRKAKVLSVEMASAMAHIARRVVQQNNMDETQIQILECHSCDLMTSTLWEGKKADLCISELLESGLLGEGILPSLRDAWDRHLNDDAIMIPKAARIYAQLVENQELIGMYVGPPVQVTLGSEDLLVFLDVSQQQTQLKNTQGGVIIPIHANFILQHPQTRILSDPVMVMDFDFSKRSSIPDIDGRSRSHSVCIHPEYGTAHAVLFWWELDLCQDVTYSTECGKQPFQDHWQQCLFAFTDPIDLKQDTSIILTCNHTDVGVSFAVQTTDPTIKRPRTLKEPSQTTPLRSALLHDITRMEVIQQSISTLLANSQYESSLIFDLSDFSLCSMIAAIAGAKRVLSWEGSSGDLPLHSARVAQLANGLPHDGASFEILQCHSEDLTIELMGGDPATLVLSEPYYETLEGWHLQEALNYWFLLRSCKLRGLLTEPFLSIPSHGRVMGCAIESAELYGAYSRCGDVDKSESICGWDHSLVNHYAARYHEHDLWLPLWQYPHRALTDPFELATLNYVTLDIEGNGIWKEVDFLDSAKGICHGIKIWIEYKYNEELTMNTNRMPYNQGFQLLQEAYPIQDHKKCSFRSRLTVESDLPHLEVHKIELSIHNHET